VVAEERPPALSSSRSGRSRVPHVALNRSLRDPNAELQELAANALGSPEPVLGRHALDQCNEIRSEAWIARTGRARLSTPEESESLAVPPKHRLGLDQKQRAAPTGKQSSTQDQ
jgi:hypothetical protein